VESSLQGSAGNSTSPTTTQSGPMCSTPQPLLSGASLPSSPTITAKSASVLTSRMLSSCGKIAGTDTRAHRAHARPPSQSSLPAGERQCVMSRSESVRR
jgi:hypothetical protein